MQDLCPAKAELCFTDSGPDPRKDPSLLANFYPPPETGSETHVAGSLPDSDELKTEITPG